MTAVFISHSSKDKEPAKVLKDWLQSQGYSVFLDIDPEEGIKGGNAWEQVLYDRLRQCQAVIPLISEHWLESKWCFAETVQARTSGKIVIPVKIGVVIGRGILDDTQNIDLSLNRDEGLERLRLALTEVFPWDPKRPPYPGLMAFQESDAAIFFGRAKETTELIELLEGQRRRGPTAERLILLLGASGSGKSSLIRAGVIPRLRGRGGWLPLSAFRPRSDPCGQLASVLAEAYERAGHSVDHRNIREQIELAAWCDPIDGRELSKIFQDLTIKFQSTDATILLTLDQAEELFGETPEDEAIRFLGLLRTAILDSAGRIMVIATLRSEFLGRFQGHPFLLDDDGAGRLAYRQVGVEPMAVDQFTEIIRRPAELSGIVVDDALVAQMVTDTRASDALPLLAYTLRRLWDDAGILQDGRFEVREYQSIGGLEGSIRTAAEEAFAAPDLSDIQRAALHDAMVPAMVRAAPDGTYVRRRTYRDEVSEASREPIQLFVEARLLITDRDEAGRETIEVAHEALLRSWPRLFGWLAEDRDKLHLSEGVSAAAQDWHKGSRLQDLLVHRGERLAEALALIEEQRFAFKPESVEANYLAHCEQEQQARELARQAEEERRLRDAELITREQNKTIRRTRQGLFAVLGVAVIAMASAWFAVEQMEEAQLQRQEAERALTIAEQQTQEAKLAREIAKSERALARKAQRQAEREERIAFARWLAAEAGSLLETSPQRALLLAVEALREPRNEDGLRLAGPESVLRDLLGEIGGVPLKGHENEIDKVRVDPRGHWIASRGGKDGNVRLWRLGKPTRKPILLDQGSKWFHSIAFDPKGRWLVAGGFYGEISLFDLEKLASLGDGDEVNTAWTRLSGHVGKVEFMRFDKEGHRLVTGTRGSNRMAIWDLDDLDTKPLWIQMPEGERRNLTGAALDPQGRYLAMSTYYGDAWLWDLHQSQQAPSEIVGKRTEKEQVVIDPAGRWLVNWGGFKRSIQFRPLDKLSASPILSSRFDQNIRNLSFDPTGRWLAVGTGDPLTNRGRTGTVALFDLDRGAAAAVPVLLPVPTVVEAVPAFDPLGRWLAVAHGDNTVGLWDPQDLSAPRQMLRGHEDKVLSLAFSSDGTRLVTGSRDKQLRIWTLPHAAASPLVFSRGEAGKAPGIAFDPGSHRLATRFKDERVMLWRPDTSLTPDRILSGSEQRYNAPPIFGPNGRWLATIPDLQLWDLQKPQAEPFQLKQHRGRVWPRLVFDPEGRWLGTTGSEDDFVRLWDLSRVAESHQLKAEEQGEKTVLRDLAFDPLKRWIATAYADETIRLWSLDDPSAPPVQLRGRWPEVVSYYGSYSIWNISFSADGRWLAVGAEDAARLYDLSQPDPEPRFLREQDETVGDGMAVVFDPLGRWLTTGRVNGTLRLWSLTDLESKPLILRAEDRPVWGATFDSAGRWLATYGGLHKKHAHLWSTEDLTLAPVILRSHRAALTTVAFDPESHWLATASKDGTARLWPLRLDALTAVACQTAGRNLGQAEWRRYFGERGYRQTCPDFESPQ